MTRWNSLKLRLWVVATVSCVVSGASLGCGAEFGKADGPRDEVIRYLGFVSDQKGKPVPNATVLVTTLNAEFKADRNGQFTHSFNFEADAPSIIFVCKSDGYKSAQGTKKQSPTDRHLILISCSMQREG